MTDLNAELWAASQAAPTAAEGSRIAQLVQEVSDLDAEIAMAEQLLAERQEQRLNKLMKDLPEAMAAAGTSEFVTANGGLKVTVGTHVSGSLPKDEEDTGARRAAIAMVEKKGGTGIITADVVAKFGRTNAEAAREAAQRLREEFPDQAVVDVREDIHHSTLKGWARGLLADGKITPEEAKVCGLWVAPMATIKEVKEKKPKAPKK